MHPIHLFPALLSIECTISTVPKYVSYVSDTKIGLNDYVVDKYKLVIFVQIGASESGPYILKI